ncbi:S66 family peptidase [Actinocatenispora rupis]|uniref:LD-carboxypeptidase n=1 Tax=Actinocatenispora rupis TaxID=519421 RepID=A0A8J3JAU8_9ACTN|nr:S66 peptidase family protein [Actinocatenispora rupis]GID13329.1 LD-carboxypeptidase [Actinocatenispora rupis]
MHTYPTKPRPGDRVAVLSPAAALPAIFPGPFELGLERLRDDFGLVPVEYPTTRKFGASPAERAADVHAAFADPDIAAIVTSIGGADQIKVLPHLDADLLRANPKPFFGLSDNTNLHVFLWNLGIVSYYGGTVMTALGRGGSMNPHTTESLRAALFTHDEYELRPAAEYTDVDREWTEPATLATEPPMLPAGGWTWHGPATTVTGPAWGGCLEIVDWNLRAGRWIRSPEAYDGSVLLLETSEEMPRAQDVYRVLSGMGERGMLQRFAAVLVGRPKCWALDNRNTPEQKTAYAEAQRDAFRTALDEYHPGVPVVFDVDFGHTDPQLVVPIGGQVTVDPTARRITVRY